MTTIIEPFILRSLWDVVESLHTQEIHALSDAALVSLLLRQVSQRVLLNGEESGCLCLYINLKLPLIRDTVDVTE